MPLLNPNPAVAAGHPSLIPDSLTFFSPIKKVLRSSHWRLRRVLCGSLNPRSSVTACRIASRSSPKTPVHLKHVVAAFLKLLHLSVLELNLLITRGNLPSG